MEMYISTYKDHFRTPWPYLKNLRWLVDFYFTNALPDRILLYLFLAGVLLILATRSRIMFPYLLSVVIFFFSKPIDLIAAAHHIILWLPCYAMIAAFPLAITCSWLWDRIGFQRPITVVAILLSPLLALALTNGPKNVRVNIPADEVRLHNVVAAGEWMVQHSKPGESLANAQTCFDPGVFFSWLEALNVPVPESFDDQRRHFPWWVRLSALADRAGLVCVTAPDIAAVQRNVSPDLLSDVADPYHDPRFQPVASFGKDPHRFDVFRFDFIVTHQHR
jgi:hypothetical protein